MLFPPFILRLFGRKPVDPLPVKNKPMLITPEKFGSLTGIVIDNFEGGYYHPNMKLKMKPSDAQKMGDSGETMFGLDRKHGAQLAAYDGWNEFWELVDGAGAATGWKHYYRGGILEPKLKALTSKIMYGWFNHLADKYLNEKSIEAIANDDRLIIHFAYSCWNGEGWFKRFAAALNKALKTSNVKEFVFQETVKARTESSNKVIRQQGANMIALFKKLHLVI